jgi:hypothetical protein
MSSTPPRSTGRSESDDRVDLSVLVGLAGQVVSAMPVGSPPDWRKVTYRTVLSAIVRDHVENGTGNLQDGDVSSLSEFVREASAAAHAAPLEHRDDAYEVLLQALLEDWVDNWEGSDDDDDDEL